MEDGDTALHFISAHTLVFGSDNLNGSIDEPVEDGDTALHLTCLYGYLPCVQVSGLDLFSFTAFWWCFIVLNCTTNYFTFLCSYSWKGEQTWRPRMKTGRFLCTMLAQGVRTRIYHHQLVLNSFPVKLSKLVLNFSFLLPPCPCSLLQDLLR